MVEEMEDVVKLGLLDLSREHLEADRLHKPFQLDFDRCTTRKLEAHHY